VVSILHRRVRGRGVPSKDIAEKTVKEMKGETERGMGVIKKQVRGIKRGKRVKGRHNKKRKAPNPNKGAGGLKGRDKPGLRITRRVIRCGGRGEGKMAGDGGEREPKLATP